MSTEANTRLRVQYIQKNHDALPFVKPQGYTHFLIGFSFTKRGGMRFGKLVIQYLQDWRER